METLPGPQGKGTAWLDIGFQSGKREFYFGDVGCRHDINECLEGKDIGTPGSGHRWLVTMLWLEILTWMVSVHLPSPPSPAVLRILVLQAAMDTPREVNMSLDMSSLEEFE